MVTVQVPLSKGKFAIVDAEDAERVEAYYWGAVEAAPGRWYAQRGSRVAGKRVLVLLHRFILGVTGDSLVDHRNGDGLDCRRENLRTATKSQNNFNRGATRRSTTGFKGIFQVKKTGRWVARICAAGTIYRLGTHATAEDAARAYDMKARELHGEFAWLNFPD